MDDGLVINIVKCISWSLTNLLIRHNGCSLRLQVFKCLSFEWKTFSNLITGLYRLEILVLRPPWYKLSKQDDVILNLLFPKLCKFQNRSMLRNWCVPYWRCKFKSCQRSIEFRIPVSSERNIFFHRIAQSPDLWQKYQSQNLLSNSQPCYLRTSRLQNFPTCHT